MKLYIKYMVSIRCKMVVKAELEKLGLTYGVVEFGEVEIAEKISSATREQLKSGLLKSGLELMDDKKAILIEKIKSVIIEMVHYADDKPKTNFSDYLTEKLSYDYTYLAKELLIYDELNLTEISYKLNYSSVAHLSTQFKKVTGLTPSFFKELKKKRKSTSRNV